MARRNRGSRMPRKANRILLAASRAIPRIVANAPDQTAGRILMSFPATFTIIAEAPLGNQAGIDTNQVGNSTRSDNGKNAGGTSDKPPVPKFALSFYNGGAMRVGGYKLPVVVKCSGVKCASDRFPIYANHIDDETSAIDQIEQLIGQTSGPCTIVQGSSLSCCGEVTGKSKTVQSVMDHAAGGFQWQASLDALPVKGHVIAEGNSEDVNGKIVAGPAYVADESILKNVAVVALGADTTARTHFAAQHAVWRSDMEFEAWLLAEYGMTKAQYDAIQASNAKLHGTIKARWDGLGNIAAGATTGVDNTINTVATGGQSVRASGGTASDGDLDPIKASRKASADEMRRVGALDQIHAKFKSVEVEIDGKKITCSEYIAKAVEDGSDVRDVELVLLRASRAASSGGSVAAANVPYANIGRGARKAGVLGEYHGSPPVKGGRYELSPNVQGFNDDNCRVIEAAFLISAGRNKGDQPWSEVLAKNKQYGPKCVEMAEDEMNRFGHGMGPMGLLCMAARMAGMGELPRNNAAAYSEICDKSMGIRAEFTTFTLPIILSNLMNKWLLDGYTSVDPNFGPGGGVAWQNFARRGAVNDFKPNYRVRPLGNFRPKGLSEQGEIQHAQIGEQSYAIQAKLKALMAGIPYQAIVDDDLNMFSTLPTEAGVGCGEQVALDVWTTFMAGLQSDNATQFFTVTDSLAAANVANMSAFAHNWNVGATTALGISGLNAAVQQFANQVKPNGQPAGLMPQCLLAPVGQMVVANQLYQDSQLIPAIVPTAGTAAAQFGTNPHKGLYRPVISQYLSNALIANNSTSTYYLTTSPTSSAYALECAFLNGSEMPIVERDEMQFNRLGIALRWWLSYGVAMGEPRSAQKNSLA